MTRWRIAAGFVAAITAGWTALAVSPAGAGGGFAAGGLVSVPHPSVGFAANQSSNWSGYNKGYLESGRTLFHSISGEWVVPSATQHVANQAEFSSSWVGIGGGCVSANCLVTDNTLIQAGTEQDVSKGGVASYSAWYELIPAPSTTVPLAVSAGNKVIVSVTQTLPAVWKITIRNVSTGKAWSKTVPYSSSYMTAEWIEETPLVFGTGGAGLSALPNLGAVHFDHATTNGVNANLKSSEEMQLVDSNNNVIATPSAPDAERDGFNDCTWATSCAVPTTTL